VPDDRRQVLGLSKLLDEGDGQTVRRLGHAAANSPLRIRQDAGPIAKYL
jgi:hypothetical protein